MAAQPQVFVNQLVRPLFETDGLRDESGHQATPPQIQLTVVMQYPGAIGQPDAPIPPATRPKASRRKAKKPRHSMHVAATDLRDTRGVRKREKTGLGFIYAILVLVGLPLVIIPLLIAGGFSLLHCVLAELLLLVAFALIVTVPLLLLRHISGSDFVKIWKSSLSALARLGRWSTLN